MADCETVDSAPVHATPSDKDSLADFRIMLEDGVSDKDRGFEGSSPQAGQGGGSGRRPRGGLTMAFGHTCSSINLAEQDSQVGL